MTEDPGAPKPKAKTGFALGRGMAALLPGARREGESRTQFMAAIEEISPMRDQPRKTFDDSDLNELAESIRRYGILQPILVRRVEGGYEIVAGERRWRAAHEAG